MTSKIAERNPFDVEFSTFAKRLKKRYKFTLDELKDCMGLNSKTSASRLLNGKATWTITNIIYFATLLKTQPNILVHMFENDLDVFPCACICHKPALSDAVKEELTNPCPYCCHDVTRGIFYEDHYLWYEVE